ncbi:MAG: tetratricopeptide repeat protein [Alphaproteobacteria bacterium]|nr:tetratricopeptide repeat protein [Alphaproteobacteria bacterium]
MLACTACPAQLQLTQTTPDELRRVEPPSPTASAIQLEVRGDELRGMKYYADAIDYYNAAMRKSGETAVLRNKIGMADIGLMKMQAAKKEFERATKVNKNYPEAWNNLGAAYYKADQNYRKAIRSYERAIKIDPDQASFHSNLGTALFARKEYDKAAHEYQRALELDPTIFTHSSRAGIAAHLSPEDRGEFAYTISKIFLQSGNIKECLLYLRKAQEEGVKVAEKLHKDPAFHSYEKDPRFLAVIHHEQITEANDRQ